MLTLYRTLTNALSPLIILWLKRRAQKGKEDPERLGERFGIASVLRPAGKLVWVHAASVGEANAALALIDAILSNSKDCWVLLTTGTVTSAALMKHRLPPRALHQFVPVDISAAVDRFFDYWRPAIGIFIDSELWPNLITTADRRGTVLMAVNARLSPRSFARWRKFPALITPILGCFRYFFAQTRGDAERLQALGMHSIHAIGNLKYDAPTLTHDAAEFIALRETIGNRPVWLAASTHPGEEELIVSCHLTLQQHYPDLLTLIVPRHALRGGSIAAMMRAQHLVVAQRSQGEPLTPATAIYLADTMGELGLFYRIATIVFMGGSLVPHGGQNPIEAAQLHTALIVGPHTGNFSVIVEELLQSQGCIRVPSAHELADTVAMLLASPSACATLAQHALQHSGSRKGLTERIMNELRPHLL